MSSVAADTNESYLATRRWFKKYPEVGNPSIPVEPFVSEKYFESEQMRLWPNVWLMLGRAEQIPEPGDYFVKAIPTLNVSLIVVRGRDRVIRAFHNVCSHRGSQLCWERNERGHVTAFKCPYHGFTYDLSGALKYVPDEVNFYGLEKERMGLRPVATDMWEGFVFVHLSPTPRETLKQYLGDISDGLSGYPFHEQNHQYSYRAEINCNWKLLISSFLEGFHVRSLHAAGVPRFCSHDNPYAHLDSIKLLGKHRLIGLFINPSGKLTRVPNIALSRQRRLLTGIAHRESTGAPTDETGALRKFVIRNIFPNFQLNLVMGGWYAYQFWPLRVDKVLWEIRACFREPVNASQHFFQYYARYASRENVMEDGRVSEQQDQALRSGVLERLVLQDEEIAIKHFCNVVENYTNGAAGELVSDEKREKGAL